MEDRAAGLAGLETFGFGGHDNSSPLRLRRGERTNTAWKSKKKCQPTEYESALRLGCPQSEVERDGYGSEAVGRADMEKLKACGSTRFPEGVWISCCGDSA